MREESYKPQREAVETRLDDMLIDIFIEPTNRSFQKMEKALKRLEFYGYRVDIYREIYEELKRAVR